MAARPPDMNDWYTRQGLTVKGGGITLQAGGAIKGGQTTYNTGVGFFMGYSGTTYKFSIGNPAGNCLTWDGTTLTVKGTIALGSAMDFASVTGATKPANNADVTLSAVNGGLSVTGGGITLSGGGSIKGGQTDYATGTGFFLGYSGAAYKFSIGSSTSYLRWTGSALSIAGDITGTSSIDLTGSAKFGGSTSLGAFTAALGANAGAVALTGILGYGGGDAGVRGQGETNSHGVIGSAEGASKAGVYGTSSHASGYGVGAYNTNGGTGVYIYTTGGLAIDANGQISGSSFLGNSLTGTGNVSLVASSGSYKATIQTDGNFVIYHGSTPYWDATTDLSDARLKENVVSSTKPGLGTINALRVVDFYWKLNTPPAEQGNNKLCTGLIAQEVQAHIPDAVKEINNTLLLHKEEIVPYLIKAVQELSVEVQSLKELLNKE